ncbi:hypothetical protein GF373_11215 [bacterium]|nr:hypothetical protein [bacterium]
MDNQDVVCHDCEDRELDVLIAVYAFIHLNGEEYCKPEEIVENVDSVNNVKVNLTFIRSWIQKEWLEKDYLNSVRVPPPIQENIEEDGFSITDCLKTVLQRQKEHKPQYDPEILQGLNKEIADSKKNLGMAYMEKKRDKS